MKRWFVGMAALGFACGGDSSGPGAASVTGVAGDNQTGSTGASLPVPLSFTALGSDGLPVEGVTVTWSATPAGAAAFSPTSGPTNANGVASTDVVLGTTVGTITMQASLNGVSPVVFHATVLDPCDSFTAYAIGQSIDAALATSDCLLGSAPAQWYYDFYSLDLPAGQQSFRLKMHGAGTFDDTYLDMFTGSLPNLQIFAFDDDSILGQEGARNAQIDLIVPGDTSLIIGANSFETYKTGSYTLSSETRPAAMNGCRQVWVVRGITASDSITATDCADSSATPRHYDVARMILIAGTVVTIQSRSTAINPALSLYAVNCNTYARSLVASNDDSSATNTNAFIAYNVATSNCYDILIGTSTAGETGAYTFEVSSSTTLSPRIAGSPGANSGRKNWWRDVGIPKRSRR